MNSFLTSSEEAGLGWLKQFCWGKMIHHIMKKEENAGCPQGLGQVGAIGSTTPLFLVYFQ